MAPSEDTHVKSYPCANPATFDCPTHCPSLALPHVKMKTHGQLPEDFYQSMHGLLSSYICTWVGGPKGGEAVKLKMPSSSSLIRWWKRRLFGKRRRKRQRALNLDYLEESGWKGEIGGWKPRGAQVFNAWSSINGHHTSCPLSPTLNIYVETLINRFCHKNALPSGSV